MDSQLKLIFDYTIFHIGLYATLITAIIAVFANDALKERYTRYLIWMKLGVIPCFLVAGAAGGLVASSIPFYKTFAEFKEAKLQPAWLSLSWLGSWEPTSIKWTHIEHFFFWIGIIFAVVGFFCVTRATRAASVMPNRRDNRAFRDLFASSISFTIARNRDLLRPLLSEGVADDACQQLAERVMEHLEQSGFEIDEAEQVMRKRPTTSGHR